MGFVSTLLSELFSGLHILHCEANFFRIHVQLELHLPRDSLGLLDLTRRCWTSHSVNLAEVWTQSPFTLASNSDLLAEAAGSNNFLVRAVDVLLYGQPQRSPESSRGFFHPAIFTYKDKKSSESHQIPELYSYFRCPILLSSKL